MSVKIVIVEDRRIVALKLRRRLLKLFSSASMQMALERRSAGLPLRQTDASTEISALVRAH